MFLIGICRILQSFLHYTDDITKISTTSYACHVQSLKSFLPSAHNAWKQASGSYHTLVDPQLAFSWHNTLAQPDLAVSDYTVSRLKHERCLSRVANSDHAEALLLVVITKWLRKRVLSC